jgi:glycosyltransferase involved in cell wall biosynthesis
MYRFAFVMDQQVGLRTQALNFENVVAADSNIEPVWVPVHYAADGGLLTHLPGVPEGVKGTLRGVREIRTKLGDPRRYDAALWATWAAKSVPDLVEGAPAFFVMDMTPVQMEDMGKLYGYTKERAQFLGRLKRRATDRIYSRAAHFFPWNKWVADSLISDYGVPAGKITPNSPGVDTELYCPDLSHRATDSVVRILFVGGDFTRKGGDLLLHWAEKTRVTVPWEIHIVTRDQVPASARVKVHHGITNNSPDLIRLYQKCELFVLPTRADCYSLVGLEAMSSGLPVVLTRLGGIPEIVEEGKTGYLIGPDDERALFKYLDCLVSDAGMRQEMGVAARARAIAQFDCRQTNGAIVAAMKAAKK